MKNKVCCISTELPTSISGFFNISVIGYSSLFIVIINIIFALLLPLKAEARNNPPPVQIPNENIEYGLDISVHEMEKAHWKLISRINIDQLFGDHEIWLRFQFPDKKWKNPAVLITGYLSSPEVWHNQKRVNYNDRSIENQSIPDPSTNNPFFLHIILFPSEEDYTGYVYLRIPFENPYNIGTFEKIYIGDITDLTPLVQREGKENLRFSIPSLCLGGILFFSGLLFLVLFLFPLKEQNYPFISFGFFSLLVGLSFISIMPAYAAFGLPPKLWINIETILFFLLPVGIVAFVEYTFISFLRPYLQKLWQFQVFLTVLAAIWFQVGFVPSYLFLLGDLIALLSIVLCFFSIYKSSPLPSQPISSSRLTMVSLFIFIIASTLDISKKLGLTSFGGYYYGFATLGLTLSFGYALLIHYKTTILKVRRYAVELETNKRKILDLEQVNLLAQFEALKNQINPHFLFNTLGTLITIIEEDRNQAINYVQELSRVYRYLLQTRNKHLVRLDEELDFIRSYAELVSSRFVSKFQINIQIPPSHYNYRLPPLGLQLLLENALKHNAVLASSPLKVDFSLEADNYIAVRNNLQPKRVVEKSYKVGLKNLAEQYRFFTDEKIIIISNSSFFIVKIPLIKMDNSTHNK